MSLVTMTAEDKARDLLVRMEVDEVQWYSAGELVELANMISLVDFIRDHTSQLQEGIGLCQEICDARHDSARWHELEKIQVVLRGITE